MTFELRTVQQTAGAVVWTVEEERVWVLVIRDRFGRWAFPKGHLDPGESAEQAARREVLEETGVSVEAVSPLHVIRYRFWEAGHLRSKEVTYFLGRVMERQALAPRPGEVSQARWVPLEAAQQYCDYPGNWHVWQLAEQAINQQRKRDSDESESLGRDGEI